MRGFLLSQNINKLSYIFAKLTIPLILTVVGAIAPMITYYGFNFYSINKVNSISMFICIFTIVIAWTLISIISAQFLNSESDIGLITFFLIIFIAVGLVLMTRPWEYSVWLCLTVALLVLAMLFIVAYLLLCKEETEIEFKGYE